MTADDVLQRIADKRQCMFTDFRERHNPDPHVQMSRRLAAVLLGQHWGNPRDERITNKLDCSPQFVEQACRLLQEDAAFRAALEELCGDLPEPTPAPEPELVAAATMEATSPEQKLKRIAKIEYGYEWASVFINIKAVKTARVRRMLMLIGRDYLSMTREELAVVLSAHVSTVDQVVQMMSEKIDHDNAFKKEVRDLCERHGIPFVRNRKC